MYSEECKHLSFPYVWCPTKEVLSKKIKWKSGEPNLANGKCIALQLGGADPGLFMEDCTRKKIIVGDILPDFYESE
jgi:hypothetical protein